MTAKERESSDSDRALVRPRSRLFTVRLWREEPDAGGEYRGTAQDLTSRATLNFREWTELATFMLECLDEDRSIEAQQLERRA